MLWSRRFPAQLRTGGQGCWVCVQGQPGASEAPGPGDGCSAPDTEPPTCPTRAASISFLTAAGRFLFGFDNMGGYNFSLLLGMAFYQDSYLSGCYYAFLIVSLRGVQRLLCSFGHV